MCKIPCTVRSGETLEQNSPGMGHNFNNNKVIYMHISACDLLDLLYMLMHTKLVIVEFDFYFDITNCALPGIQL